MLKAGVPTQAVAEHHGTSGRMIEANYAKFVPSDRAKYVSMAVPELRLRSDNDKVVRLRSGGVG
jgi:hypothetical protein